MTEEEFKNNGLIIGIEDISTKIKWGLNALYCVYTAMAEGPCIPESYTDGLFLCMTVSTERWTIWKST